MFFDRTIKVKIGKNYFGTQNILSGVFLRDDYWNLCCFKYS